MKSGNLDTNRESKPQFEVQPDTAKDTRTNGPTSEEIRRRAFELHIEHGGIYGSDLEDWLQAEHELQEKYRTNNQRAKA